MRTYVAPANLVLAAGADDLADDVLPADEVLFHVDAFHYVPTVSKKKKLS